MRSVLFTVVMVTVMLAARSMAGERELLRGHVDLELANEGIYQKDDAPGAINLLLTDVDSDLRFHASPQLFLRSTVIFRPIALPDDGDFSAFQNHGLFAQELAVHYHTEAFGVHAGKFNPNDVEGFTQTPDLYDTAINNDDLQLQERVGFGGFVEFDTADYGTHRLYGSAFMKDTSILSGSALTNRGRTKRSDGGPSNTRLPESVHLGLYGGGFSGLDDATYYAGFTRQAVDLVDDDDRSPADEYWVNVAVQQTFELDDGLKVSPLIEYFRVWNAGGFAGETHDTVTLAARLTDGPASILLASTSRFVSDDDGEDYIDVAAEVVGTYHLESLGLTANVTWAYSRLEGATTQLISTSITRKFAF